MNLDNIIQDDNYYYFFRALNMGDLSDIKNGITVSNNHINMIRTDRERYDGIPKYREDDLISLEQVFDHIKNHHRYDTNCISLSSNANVTLDYGRGNYKDQYVMIKIPKNELGYSVVNAGLYMINEINSKIQELINIKELSDIERYYISRIDEVKTQDELNIVIEELKRNNSDNFERGIIFDITNSINYSSLNEQENLEKNKTVLKLDVIRCNIISNASNKFLIQTLGSAFSSLEYIHYNSITGDKINYVNRKIIDIFSLLQQLPSSPLLDELKLELLNNINNQNINNYEYNNYHLNVEDDYTIDKMYELTLGTIDYNTSINMYKKSFYLAKSKLRMKDTLNLLKTITNNNPKYNELYKLMESSTFGIEPEIISRQNSNKINISESVSLDFNLKEIELFNFVNQLNIKDLEFILKNPTKTFEYYLNHFNIEKGNYTKDEYFANAIIDLFEWKKLNIISISSKQRRQIIDKLIENNVVDVYYSLKEKGVKEEKIANVLLTSIIRKKDLANINVNETFSVEELEDFLGYYKVHDSNLILRPYQASALENGNEILKYHNFYAAIMPTGSGKSFLSLAKMLENRNAKMLYLAPNDIILNQLEDYIIKYIYGTKGTFTKNKKQIIKEVFPNLKLCTYQLLLSENQDKIINVTYDLIFLDELHRSGASEWYSKVKKLMNNQPKTTKVIGITATPERTNDDLNMANEWAKYFGYTDKEIELHKHLAINMDIEQAIKLGYVVNPKVVFCEYNLFSPGGVLYNLHERINLIQDENFRNRSIEEFKRLRKIVEKSHGISKIIGDNLKLGDRCLVFLPVVNKDGKVIEDEDGNIIDYRIYGDEVIEKYKYLIISYLQEYYHLSKDEINDMVEFHSMLGKYGKGKNQYELEKFEQKDSKKIKFMLLMNKGNEGMHAECEREIHLRPTESINLILQLLGRVEYGILPNQIIPDEERPTVIDLVGNLFVYALNKEKNKVDDLDKLKVVMDWINNTGIIPSIDSNDKVEYMHAITLRSIKNKYIKYLTIDDKDKITTKTQEILRLGSMIDLWYIEYPEIIISKDGSKKTITEDDTFFELTGVLQDLCELNKEVDRNLYMSFEEKKNELIKSIHELYRLPKDSSKNFGHPEKIFKDGTNQRNFYNNLQITIKTIQEKLNNGIEITEEEQQKLDLYNEINRVLSQYVIELSLEEKVQELINSIHELRRLPKEPYQNSGQSEKKFKDGKDQRNFYNNLQMAIKTIQEKLNNGIEITEEEQQKLDLYNEINRVLSKYVIELSLEEKVQELIRTVQKLHRLPKQIHKNYRQSERKFKNGKDQRNFYDKLKLDIKKIQEKLNNGIEITEEEQQKLKAYNQINRVLSQYVIEVSLEEKVQELINSIHELHRLPKLKERKYDESEKLFEDGTDQRNFYESLKKTIEKIQEKLNNGIEITDEEQENLDAFDEINMVLSQYVIEVSFEEKVKVLIKSIHELHRLPKVPSHNSGRFEKVFRDGTDQRNFYVNLKQNIQIIQEKINNGIEITEEEQQKLKAYNQINRVLSQYVIEVSLEEKVQELINSIHELQRLPKRLSNKFEQPEREFRDGTSQRNFYEILKTVEKEIQEKVNNGVEITKEEQEKLDAYNRINKVLSEYVIEVSFKEKIQELIKSIQGLHRLPKLKKSNNNISEKVFKDGTDMRSFYNELKKSVNKIKVKDYINLTEEEHKKIADFEEIERVLSFYPSKISSNQNMILELCNQYGIDTKINKSLLDKSYYEVYIKLMYLIDNNIPIINNGTLCDIFYMADMNMQVKYGISMDELFDKYIINSKRL